MHRLIEVGVPATIEHVSEKPSISSTSTKHVVEAVQVINNFPLLFNFKSFITLMDAIKINQVAVDQLHPMLGDLLRSVNRIPNIKGENEWKNKLKQWYFYYKSVF